MSVLKEDLLFYGTIALSAALGAAVGSIAGSALQSVVKRSTLNKTS